MAIGKLTILGKSDGLITMILDNLESCNLYPEIEIINNLNFNVEFEIYNPKFHIELNSKFKDGQHILLGVYKSAIKILVYNEFNIERDRFINVIHSSTQISSTVVLGRGCIINSLVSIGAHTTLGDFVTLNRNISVGHHTNISDFVTINPGANIAGNVSIGKGTLIGMGSNIIDNIKIGSNTIIGAGSLVTKDIPDNVVAYGQPCKIVRLNEA